MSILIRLVIFVFVVAALFYIAAKMGYIEITAKGEVALKTVLSDIFIASRDFSAGTIRRLADFIQSSPQQ